MNRPTGGNFAKQLQAHLANWAQNADGFRDDGHHPWVLEPSASTLNYFGGKEWEALLSGQRHRWGHALNSSQAFAVNLFGPAR